MIQVALKLAYLGTDFHGFQRQPGLRTVEGELLAVLQQMGVIENLEGSSYSIGGRTDRGVHALGNVVSFITRKMPIINQINDLLPKDMRVWGSAEVPSGFKARYANGRHYRYVFSPILDGETLDIKKMQEAAHLMEGTHNYMNFSRKSERNPIRKVDSVNVKLQNQTCLVDVVGESFLWNMVRKMVSVLMSVGRGDLEVEEVEKFFNPLYIPRITPMPSESLVLMDVKYDDVHFRKDDYARMKFLQTLNREFLNHQSMAATTFEMIRSLKGD